MPPKILVRLSLNDWYVFILYEPGIYTSRKLKHLKQFSRISKENPRLYVYDSVRASKTLQLEYHLFSQLSHMGG